MLKNVGGLLAEVGAIVRSCHEGFGAVVTGLRLAELDEGQWNEVVAVVHDIVAKVNEVVFQLLGHRRGFVGPERHSHSLKLARAWPTRPPTAIFPMPTEDPG